MANKNILAFHQLATFIYELKAAALGLDPELPPGLENVDSPGKAIEWLKTVGKPASKQVPKKIFPLKSIFPDVSLGAIKENKQSFYYRPFPLSPNGLMEPEEPVENFERSLKELWDAFIRNLDDIPGIAKGNFAVWFDCMVSAWQSVSWCLTDSDSDPENMIPLYEKSRVATVLNGIEGDPVLLIQGDFQGIQNFIFTSGGSVNKNSAKLLRGRSFYVSLITELAALAVVEKLKLTSLNVVNQAAGKFLILAPNTEENIKALDQLQDEFNRWFVKNTLATANLCLASVPTKRKKLSEKSDSFAEAMGDLFKENEKSKLTRRFFIERPSPVLDEVNYEGKVSEYDDRLPQNSLLVVDEIAIGNKLVKSDLLCITRSRIDKMDSSKLEIFGYWFTFLDKEDLNRLPPNMIRLWDFSLPEDFDKPIFTGIARRDFNGYVAHFSRKDESEANIYKNFCKAMKYDEDGTIKPNYSEEGEIKPFEFLACDNRKSFEDAPNGERCQGLVALGILKGDVDNLGKIFRIGLKNENTKHESTLCRMLTVSRMLQSFFTVYLPVLCKKEFPNTYTVFAGGDDFFLIGPWHGIQELAFEFQNRFKNFTANDEIHFSAGIVLVKPVIPPKTLAELSETALEKAKVQPEKNAVCIYGEVVPWSDMAELIQLEKELNEYKDKFDISNGYLYKLFEIMNLAEDESRGKPEKVIWRSLLSYNTARLAERKKLDSTKLITFMVTNIKNWKRKFRIPLSNLFYQMRIS